MSAAAGFPGWVLFEPYVFRRDDEDSFPDDTEAPIRASGTTSRGADIRIAFSLAEPPRISRLYAQLPSFPPPNKESPLRILANHRHLALLDITTELPSEGLVNNSFIFRVNEDKPSSSSLMALPPCTEPLYDTRLRFCLRLLNLTSSGLWCGGDKEEFVVAELTLYVRTVCGCTDAAAGICFLRSSFTDGGQPCRSPWDSMLVPILSTTEDDLWKLSHWQTSAVIPFQRWLCWVDYRQGILFWDVSEDVTDAVSFLWFFPGKSSIAYGKGGVSVVNHGRDLKFVNVASHDDRPAYGMLKPGAGFTITCHILVLGDGSMGWKEDYTVTSDELPDHLQHDGILMFPQVDIVRPQVVHFLFCDLEKAYRKISVISIDLSTKTLESSYVYVDGNELVQTNYKPCLPTVHIHFIRRMNMSPRPPLPFEFPGFCYLSRKRKDMV